MKLHYTPRSHFARKVRIIAEALAVPLELVDAGNIAHQTAAGLGDNPLCKVPTLVLDDDQRVFESDHIVQTIVRHHDPDDRFDALSTQVETLNLRAVLNGIMSADVELVLADRTGIDTDHPRFDKMRRAIIDGLDWLEGRADRFAEAPSYAGFHLVCAWDHLALYELVPLPHPKLGRMVQRLSELPFVASSRPS